MKMRKMHEVRYWPSATAYSRHVGNNPRLRPYAVARKLVARLRRSGVDAFTNPIAVRA